MIIFSAALAVASSAFAVPTTPTTDLKAAGPWKVDYSEAACLLSRPFTAPDGSAYQAEFTFEPLQVETWLRLRSSEKPPRRDDGKTTVEVDGNQIANDVHFNIFGSPGGAGTTREFWLRDIRKLGSMKQSLRLATQKRGDFRLAADGFHAAARAIDTCMNDLHSSLGIDPAIIKTIAVPPEGSSFGFMDYPIGSSGFQMTLLYWITADGKVENCRILKPSGQAAFDKVACARLEKKGHFTPAKDASGKPIRAPKYEDLNLRREIIRIES